MKEEGEKNRKECVGLLFMDYVGQKQHSKFRKGHSGGDGTQSKGKAPPRCYGVSYKVSTCFYILSVAVLRD